MECLLSCSDISVSELRRAVLIELLWSHCISTPSCSAYWVAVISLYQYSFVQCLLSCSDLSVSELLRAVLIELHWSLCIRTPLCSAYWVSVISLYQNSFVQFLLSCSDLSVSELLRAVLIDLQWYLTPCSDITICRTCRLGACCMWSQCEPSLNQWCNFMNTPRAIVSLCNHNLLLWLSLLSSWVFIIHEYNPLPKIKSIVLLLQWQPCCCTWMIQSNF